MRLFIAEKPDLAKAIVDGLGGGSRKDGFYDCGNDYVTWCYGHMLQLLDPEDYDPRMASGLWTICLSHTSLGKRNHQAIKKINSRLLPIY